MVDDSKIDKFSDFFWTLRLKDKLSYLSLNVNHPQDRTKLYLESLREIASEINFENGKFNNLLDCYLTTHNKNDLAFLDRFVDSYYKGTENEIVNIPNDLNKSYYALIGLIKSKYFENNLQVYDALVLMRDEISKDLIKEIIVEWKLDLEFCRSQNHLERPNTFWVSKDFMSDIDDISMYRFKEIFDIKGFDSTFKEVKKELEIRIWEFSPPNELSQGPFYFWLIDRVPHFIDEYYGTNNFLESIAEEQNAQGYWENKSWIKSQIVDQDTRRINSTEYEVDTSGTALSSICLIKHSKYDELRKKGMEGVGWLLEQQNSDGSWSDEIRSRSSGSVEKKKSLFATILATEALIRSGIPNLDPQLELSKKWIMDKQNKWGWWEDDEFLPLFQYSSFPLMTVLILELENLFEAYKKQEPNVALNDSKSKYEYDFVVSFAGEDRDIVEEYVSLLKSKVSVFYDKDNLSKLWGKNLYDELYDIYTSKAEYCVIFVSKHYLEKMWTNHERRSAQERALKEKKEYILPIILDDTKIPGIPITLGHLDLRELTIREIANETIKKLNQEDEVLK